MKRGFINFQLATVVAKKAAPKKAAEEGLVAYNVKLKQSELMNEPTINIKNNRYIAKGTGSDGTNMALIMNKEKAEAAIAAGWAAKGEGWPKAAPAAKKK